MKPHYLLIICILFSISISSSLSWDFNKGGIDWEQTCQEGLQAPIDIAKPFTYRQTNLTFSYSNMMTEYSFYNNGNNLILEGDFGYMDYNGVTFFSAQIMFYSPSMHTIDHEHLPLEMQIIHYNSKGEMLTVSVVFKHSESDYSLLLGKLHFDQADLQKMTPFKPIFIKDQINLSKYLHSDQTYFIYDTVETIPPCSKRNTMVILSDILYVSRKQLDNFPLIIRNKNKLIQDRGERKLYVTFDIEEIKALIESNHLIVNQNKQRKVEETKIELVKQTLSNRNKIDNHTPSFNASALEANGTSAEEIQKALERELKKTIQAQTVSIANNSNSNKTDTTKFVPFDLVKERAIAKESSSKKVDLKQIGNVIDNDNETMIIDKEIPLSQSKLIAKREHEKYLRWKELKKNATKIGFAKPRLLLELYQLENDLLTRSHDNKKSKPTIDRNDYYQNIDITNEVMTIPLIISSSDSKLIDDSIQSILLKTEPIIPTNSKTIEQLLQELAKMHNEREKHLENGCNLKKNKKEKSEEKNTIENKIIENVSIESKSKSNQDNLEIVIKYYQRLEEIMNNRYQQLDALNDTISKLNTLENEISLKNDTMKEEYYIDLLFRITFEKNTLIKLNQKNHIESENNKQKDNHPNEDIIHSHQNDLLQNINEAIYNLEQRLKKIKVFNENIYKRNTENNNLIDSKLDTIQEQIQNLELSLKELKEEHDKSNNSNELEANQLEEIQKKQSIVINQNKDIIEKLTEIESELNNKQQIIQQDNVNSNETDVVVIDNDPMYKETEMKLNYSNHSLQNQEKDDNDLFSYVRIVKDASKEDINEQIQIDTNDKQMLEEKMKDLNQTLQSIYTNTSISKKDPIIDKEKSIVVNQTQTEQQPNQTPIDNNEQLFKDTLLRINEKYQEHQMNSNKKNLRKPQPNLSSSQIDYQLLQILSILLNQLQSKCSSNDKTNSNNSSYYPYLTEDGKIKITFTSLLKLFKFSYDIASIPLIRDNQASMILKYIDELLIEQNAKLFTLTPHLYIFNNVTTTEISQLSNDISKNMPLINANKAKEIIIHLMNNTPIKVINDNDLFTQIKALNTVLPTNECQSETPLQSITLSKYSNNKDEWELIVNMMIPNEKEDITVMTTKSNKVVVKGYFGYFQQGTHLFEINSIELYSPGIHVFEETKHRAVMEMLLIGKDANGEYSVIAVQFALGNSTNAFLNAIGIKSISKESSVMENIKPKDYYMLDLSIDIPNKPQFVTYYGPMISSPCLSNVKWIVLTKNQMILTQEQFYSFNRLMGK